MGLHSSLSAQELPAADQRKLDAINQTIELSPRQKSFIDSLYFSYAVKISKIDSSLKVIQRSEALSESQLLTRMSVLNQEKKDLRSMRDLDTKMFLTPDQKVVFDEKVVPQKPQVLHFGIHNRADCVTCDK